MVEVPVVDLREVDDVLLRRIDAACADHGFFHLVNHGLDEHLTNLQEQARAFFAQPKQVKLEVERSPDNQMGYFDRELTKHKRDQKEVFDFYATRSPGGTRNMPWPDKPAEFKEKLTASFFAHTELSLKVLGLLCRALGRDEHTLDAHFAPKHTSLARLNFYPSVDPLAAAEQEDVAPLGDMALHHHTDPGALTLLYQDAVGGLQTFSAREDWIDVAPIEGSIVVNVGDIFQVWSNGRYKAALHRVVPVPVGKSRYSMPFFFQPHMATQIEPLSGLGDPIYRSFSWADFIQGRVTDNYAPTGEDDIQVEKYRIGA